ncbi:MAG: ankyrin repeat domain-containing protein, partial [Deltaproteobacteria bacterium]|nr:ankyrin repeat domain-containing protein [Deltaproteobacteria bacterium]
MLGRAQGWCWRWGLAWAVLVGAAGAARASWGLREAARAGDVVHVREALAAGDDPSGEPGEPTPLMEAAMGGHTRVMDVLARAGADLERRDSNGDRALHWAVAFRQEGAVAWFIAHRADLAARGHGGRTPLLAAVASSSLPIVTRLLAAGASARDHDDMGWGAAYMATIWSSSDVLAAVLARGASANDSDGSDESVLMAAALRDEPRKIGLLAARGADMAQAGEAWLSAARQKARGAMAALLPYAPASPEA